MQSRSIVLSFNVDASLPATQLISIAAAANAVKHNVNNIAIYFFMRLLDYSYVDSRGGASGKVGFENNPCAIESVVNSLAVEVFEIPGVWE